MLFEVCVQQEVASLLMICFNSLLKDGRSNVQSPLNHNSCQTGVSDHSEGSFPQNKQLCLLVKGIDIPWKTFCSDKVPACLPYREMKIPQPAVVMAPWKPDSLALRRREGHVCFLYYLLRNLSKHCILGMGKKH